MCTYQVTKRSDCPEFSSDQRKRPDELELKRLHPVLSSRHVHALVASCNLVHWLLERENLQVPLRHWV